MSRPASVVACPSLPDPPVSGGRKRALRLIEALERAGTRPHVLALAGTSEQIRALQARGWSAEVHPNPPKAKSDEATQITFQTFRQVLKDALAIRVPGLAGGPADGNHGQRHAGQSPGGPKHC